MPDPAKPDGSDAESEPESSPAGKKVLKILAVVAGLAALVLLGRQAGGYVTGFAEWVEGLGFWGPVAFIGGYALATVAFVPGSLLTLAGGAIFGLAFGTLYVFVGASLGACLAFVVSRYLARKTVEKKLEGNEKFKVIDQAVGRQGLKITFLMRLSPIFPFNLLNYGLGLTDVRFVHYALACFGMLPGTFLYVYYGKALGSIAAITAGGAEQEKGIEQWIFLGIGLVATVVVTWFVTRIARRALDEEVENE